MRFRGLQLEIHPIDWVIVGLLLVAVVVGAARLRSQQPELYPLLTQHLSVLAGFLAFAAAAIRWQRSWWVIYARPVIAAAIIYSLYTSLGLLGMSAMGYRADAALSRIDAALFGGTDPTFLIEHWITPARVELFAFFYVLFLAYVNLSLVLGALGRPPLERDQFFTGWVSTYAFCYLGYIFLPAHGPGVFHAAAYHVPLMGGYFYQLILRTTAATGGELGVFPSLHGGASVYLCNFDLGTNRLRGLTYVPIVILIFMATVVLRIHYVIDLIVGTAVALTCRRIGPRVLGRWARLRQAEGLPALPGGEADVLPALSNIRGGRVTSVLSAY